MAITSDLNPKCITRNNIFERPKLKIVSLTFNFNYLNKYIKKLKNKIKFFLDC
jgi:hypothetical protein